MLLMRAWMPAALMTLVSLVCAPAAFADNSISSNWAGYAVHRSGVTFPKVSASWAQPDASCTPGRRTYSAFWVGLGGYSANSQALEQIGTEADCNSSGNAVLSAWYELVPAPSIPIRLSLAAGDLINASVTVVGHRATLSLYDATRHRGFSKTFHAPTVDLTSAEWIVEAPSACISADSCQTLPLANFGSASFDSARVQSSGGHQGAISDPAWSATKIKLTPGGRRFVTYQRPGPAAGAATPSALQIAGSSFRVTYSPFALQANPFLRAPRSAVLSSGYLEHPGR
jgi:hypothetical protein